MVKGTANHLHWHYQIHFGKTRVIVQLLQTLNLGTSFHRQCFSNSISSALPKFTESSQVRLLALKDISIQGMIIALVRDLRWNVIQVTLAKLIISPLVLVPQAKTKYSRQTCSGEENSCTCPHALGVPRLVCLGEQTRAQDRAALADHAEDGQTGTSLGGRALVIRHPREGECHSGEDTGADQEGGEITDAGSVDSRQDHVACGASAAKKDDEYASHPETVGDKAGRDADHVCGQVRAGREALSAQRGVAHGLQDRGEVGRERAEGGVETEDDHRLQVVLVVTEGSKGLFEVELAISFLATALEGALTYDLILSGCKESALGGRRRKKEVYNDPKNNCRSTLCLKKILSDSFLR